MLVCIGYVLCLNNYVFSLFLIQAAHVAIKVVYINIRKPLCRTNILGKMMFYRCVSAWNRLSRFIAKSKSGTTFNILLELLIYRHF